MTTEFQEKVYTKLRKVPRGKVTTYKALAKAVGTRAYRAVGTAMNKNPYSFADGGDVPCHRVVKSNGEVGGFAERLCGRDKNKSSRTRAESRVFGTKNKIKILKSECIVIENGKIKDFEKKLHKF